MEAKGKEICGVDKMIHFDDSSAVSMKREKKLRGRPRKDVADGIVGSYKKKQQLSPQGGRVAYSVGANFAPHIITVNAGEDISMKIVSLSQQGSRAICILAANGVISNVTLRQPNLYGGNLTYKGRFEILSLSGSFMPIANGGVKSIAGSMSVSLAGPNGRVMGGELAGLFIAAGPIQVIIGSFLTGNQQEPKPKKQRPDFALTLSPVPAINQDHAGGNDVCYTAPLRSITPASYHGNNVSAGNYVNGQSIVAEENDISVEEGQIVA